MRGFIPILLIMVVLMYVMMIRPQKKQQRRHKELLANLKPGDEVITAGGIYGDVVGIEDEKVHLLIAEDVEIEVARRSIATVVPLSEHDADDEAGGLEEAGTSPVDRDLEQLGRAKGAQPRRKD
jgi:preprotein translocase subunit YajC